MYQAIQTKFIGPTNHRGARIKAYGQVGSVTVSYQFDSKSRDHHSAAQKLAEKFGWSGVWVYGGSPDGKGNVYVNVGSQRHLEKRIMAASGTLAFVVEPK